MKPYNLVPVALFGLLLACIPAHAAPFAKTFPFVQPDGTQIELWGEGDEFSAVFETLDGHTVTFDPATKAYHYAALSADGSDLVKTETAVGKGTPPQARHLRIKPEVARKRALENRTAWEDRDGIRQRWEAMKAARQNANAQPAPADATSAGGETFPSPPSYTTTGSKVGLTLLIDFDDDPASVPKAEIVNFLNADTYSGYGNNGSVKKFFQDNSNGLLTYTNVVTAYVRIPNSLHPKSYYTDTSQSAAAQARKLIADAIGILKTLPNYPSEILPSFAALTTTGTTLKTVSYMNVFFAGGNGGVWNKGLWPHKSTLWPDYPYLDTNLRCSNYQITDIGSGLELGTFCHENGHMLCGFPDLYDYDGGSKGGAGVFCIMNHGNYAQNPAQFCAYLKRAAGWATTVELNSASNLTASVSSSGTGFNKFYRYARPGVPTEYYLIENRQKTGRDSNIPASGIAIWHIDELGNKDNQSLAYNSAHENFEVTLMQADNLWQLQNNVNFGDSKDLYYAGNTAAGYTNSFNDAAGPSARWWDGSQSNLNLKNFSASATTMTFLVTPPLPRWNGDDLANQWDNSVSNNWSHDGGLVPFIPGASAQFDDAGSAFPAVNLVGNLQPDKVVVDTVQNYTLAGSGSMSGAMTLTKRGSGTLTLANTNTYTGDTHIDEGTLRLQSGPPLVVANASFESPIVPTNDRIWTPASSGWTYSGIDGGGCAIGNGSNWAAGGYAKNQYLLSWHQGSASQSLSLAAGTYTVNFAYCGRNNYAAAGLRFFVDDVVKGSWPTSNDQKINSWVKRSATFTIATSGTHTIKFDFPPPVPNPSADWGGNVDAIEIFRHSSNAPASAVPAASRVLVETGATFDVNGCNTTVGPLSHSGTNGGTVTNGSTGPATLTINVGSGAQTFSGLITDNGAGRELSLAKTGAGTQTLGGANSFNGGVSIQAGTLALQGVPVEGLINGTFWTPTLATDSYSGPSTATWSWGKTPGEADGSCGMANGSTPWAAGAAGGTQYCYYWRSGMASQNVTLQPGNYTIYFALAGRPGFTPANLEFRVAKGGVTQTIATFLSADQTDSWTERSASFTVTSPGTHTLIFACTQPSGASDWGSCIDSVRLPLPVSVAPAASSALPAGSTVTVTSGGTLDLSGATQQIAALSDGGSPGGVVTNNQVSSATLTLNPTGGSRTFSGQITNGGSGKILALIKNGAGTQVLSGTNSHTGGTTVGNGSLVVSGQLAGPVLVTGGTLGGTGSITGTVTVQSSGRLDPGPGAGTLSLAGASLQAGSTTLMDIGSSSDRLAIAGNAALGGTLQLNVAPGTTFGRFPLITHGGTRTGTLSLTGLPVGTSAQLAYLTGEVVLYIGDSDEDRLPDTWEQARFGGLSQNADDDYDHDGTSNLVESRLGLDPTSGASAFAPTISGTMLVWPSAPGIVFSVKRSLSLAGNDWVTITTVTGGPEPTARFTDLETFGQAFYKIGFVP